MAKKRKQAHGKKRQAVIVLEKKKDVLKKTKTPEIEIRDTEPAPPITGKCTICIQIARKRGPEGTVGPSVEELPNDCSPCPHCAYPTQVFLCEEHAPAHHQEVHGHCCVEDCQEQGIHMCRYCYDLTHGPAEFRCNEHMIRHIQDIYRGPKCHREGCEEWAACFRYVSWRLTHLHADDIKRQESVYREMMERQLASLMDGCHRHHGYHHQPYANRLQLKWDPARFNELFGGKQWQMGSSAPVVKLGV